MASIYADFNPASGDVGATTTTFSFGTSPSNTIYWCSLGCFESKEAYIETEEQIRHCGYHVDKYTSHPLSPQTPLSPSFMQRFIPPTRDFRGKETRRR